MRKRLAPLAALFGLLTAMMLASTSMAQASPLLPTFTGCTNGGVNVNVVTCNDILNNIKVTITDNRVLTDNELTILKDALNGNEIEILNVEAAIKDIEAVTVDVYDSFNPSIDVDVDDIEVCIALICK
jgi:hypothetical protein